MAKGQRNEKITPRNSQGAHPPDFSHGAPAPCVMGNGGGMHGTISQQASGAPALAAAVAPRHRLITTLNVVFVCAFVMRKVAEYEGRPLRSGSGVADGIPGRPWRSGSGVADGIPGRPWRSGSGAADGSINPLAKSKFFSDEQPRRIRYIDSSKTRTNSAVTVVRGAPALAAAAAPRHRLICTRCHADVESVLQCRACGALCPTSRIGSGMLSSRAFAFYVLALVVAAIFLYA